MDAIIGSRWPSLTLPTVLLLLLAIGNPGCGTRVDRGHAPHTKAQAGEGSLDAIRSGRLDEAFARYDRPGSSGPTAAELAALGRGLLDRDRTVLGWAAMEAAHRVDPNDPLADRALDELGQSLALSSGTDHASRRRVVEEVEHLGSIPDGPGLGLLVMGLARFAPTPARERAFLDRFSILDRAPLREVRGPSGAIKLIAQLLMRMGRPSEAADLLGPFTEGVDPDREAAWLLSRAALQLGRDELADTMLERAGGPDPGASRVEPSPYVGSRRCGDCHRHLYRMGQKESPHARTLSLGSDLASVPLPDAPIPDPLAPGIRHRFTREADGRPRLETSDDRGRIVRAVVAYALGSGEHGITMVARDDPGGTPRELRISYYAADRSWRLTKGVNAVPSRPDEFVGLPLSGRALEQCLQCHTTWFRAALPDPENPTGPESGDRGIGCERCHGPGLNHVRAVEGGFADSAIAVTTRSPARRLLESCQECHGVTGSVEPSDPEFTRVQGTTLRFSRCFTATEGALHCTTCHDPHRGLVRSNPLYESKCLKCHSSNEPAHTGKGRALVCPVNPAANCIDCHMPKVADPRLQARFTDHHIRVHREKNP